MFGSASLALQFWVSMVSMAIHANLVAKKDEMCSVVITMKTSVLLIVGCDCDQSTHDKDVKNYIVM